MLPLQSTATAASSEVTYRTILCLLRENPQKRISEQFSEKLFLKNRHENKAQCL